MSGSFSRIPSDIFPPGVCELTVSYQRKKEKRIKISRSSDAAEFARTTLYSEGSIEYAEQFFVLMLDRRHHVFAYKLLSHGGMTGTVVDPRLLYQAVLLCHATAIVLVHNHPSGNTKPSDADIALTKKLYSGGKLLEIDVLDHIIIGEDGFYSFADDGLL